MSERTPRADDAAALGADGGPSAGEPAGATHAPASGTVTQPRLGAAGTLRWLWRQLTSMKTALVLLMLLAVAALPGSIWPQRGIDAVKVEDYLAAHPKAGPWLDRVGMFDVFASPWFAAIYLLLVVSLIGCIVPRVITHAKAWRNPPPQVPRNLSRLPGHATGTVAATPEEVLAAARQVLRRSKQRPAADTVPGALSAEGGFWREVGNIAFHLGFVVIILAVAWGHLLGWKGEVIVPEGGAFSNTLAGYDTFDPGPLVEPGELDPFTVKIDSMDVAFEDQRGAGRQMGQPRRFAAETDVTEADGSTSREHLAVNHPLVRGDASVFLLGNGYAPVITVKDAKGTVLYSQPTPFLPQDNNYRSVGAVKVPSASPKQLGFVGFFLPTLAFDQERGPISVFPDKKAPALVLTLYEGDLFPGGRPQNVYALDTSTMTQVKNNKGEPLRILLSEGDTVELPGGRGTLTYEATPRWAGLSVRYDPGKNLALAAACLSLLGLVLSLAIRRRRFFVKATATDDGRTLVEVGALAKGEDPRIQVAAEELLASLQERLGSGASTAPAPSAPAEGPTPRPEDPEHA